MTLSNKKLHKHVCHNLYVCHNLFVCQLTHISLKNLPPCSPVAVQFLVHLRLPVADGPQKSNSRLFASTTAF